MHFIIRWTQRIFVFCFSIGTLWLIVTQIFDRFEDRMPFFVALILTYLVSAYLLLPQIIRFSTMIVRRRHIPHMTRAMDGLLADPVNIIFTGTARELCSAFADIGWHQADPLNLKSAWKMINGVALNKPYAQAPFSRQYLFGRTQDFEFQQAIGNSPRKRHHIRFWAANIDPQTELGNLRYWIKKHPVDPTTSTIWVGAGTEDMGLGIKKLTYQISHRTNKEVDTERDYIIDSLKQKNRIQDIRHINTGELVAGKYISDGKIILARLT
ncbi:MAG: LssY C-terminal domain-containing protein [Candidatus Magasanikbacteria bacterium]|nr:LssY C-terminal domain-containing protein [Candidatus Magasanikbacteria bacterium]